MIGYHYDLIFLGDYMYRIVKAGDFKTTLWQGGKTTELYIYPEDGSYKDRNFEFRISSATVEDERSVFTRLEDINRQIVLLDGNMKLVHNDVETVILSPYVVHSFSGEVRTVSYGKAEDFNLMLKGCKGTVNIIDLMENDSFEVNSKWEFVYCKLSDLKIMLGAISIQLNAGDLLIITNHEKMQAEVTGSKKNIKVINVKIG